MTSKKRPLNIAADFDDRVERTNRLIEGLLAAIHEVYLSRLGPATEESDYEVTPENADWQSAAYTLVAWAAKLAQESGDETMFTLLAAAGTVLSACAEREGDTLILLTPPVLGKVEPKPVPHFGAAITKRIH